MITYCTSIHPGESWREVTTVLATSVLEVRRGFGSGDTFPIGLRLSARAADEANGDALGRLRDFCDEHACAIYSLNGFPYGEFTRGAVKEKVYLPDWRSPRRLAYTVRLGEVLAAVLPRGGTGSVSTVPLGFRRGFPDADLGEARANLVAAVRAFAKIRDETGKDLVLAIEPEPGCWLATIPDLVAFVASLSLPTDLAAVLGVCFDACHHAVMFEDPTECLALIRGAGLRLARVQASSAVSVCASDASSLRGFVEPRYLHQTVVQMQDGALRAYDDLDAALAAAPAGAREWRVHFHLPIYFEGQGALRTTQPFLRRLLALVDPTVLVEVETYSFAALPEELRRLSVVDSTLRELAWVRRERDASHRRT